MIAGVILLTLSLILFVFNRRQMFAALTPAERRRLPHLLLQSARGFPSPQGRARHFPSPSLRGDAKQRTRTSIRD